MTLVILRDGAVHEQPVKPRAILVSVTQSLARIYDSRNAPIRDAALRMRIDRNVVAVSPQLAKQRHRTRLAGADEVLLINRIDMRISIEQVLRPFPSHEYVNCRVRRIGAQLVNKRCGKQRVANPRV